MNEDLGDCPSAEERVPAYHLDPKEREEINQKLYGQGQLEIIEVALTYLNMNLDAANKLFGCTIGETDASLKDLLFVNGRYIAQLERDQVEQILFKVMEDNQ